MSAIKNLLDKKFSQSIYRDLLLSITGKIQFPLKNITKNEYLNLWKNNLVSSVALEDWLCYESFDIISALNASELSKTQWNKVYYRYNWLFLELSNRIFDFYIHRLEILDEPLKRELVRADLSLLKSNLYNTPENQEEFHRRFAWSDTKRFRQIKKEVENWKGEDLYAGVIDIFSDPAYIVIAALLKYEDVLKKLAIDEKLDLEISNSGAPGVNDGKDVGTNRKSKQISPLTLNFDTNYSDRLKSIYENLSNLELIKSHITTKDLFIKIFCSKDLRKEANGIYFNCDNNQLRLILNLLRPMFTNWKWATLERSEKFLKENNMPLKAADIYKYSTPKTEPLLKSKIEKAFKD